MATSNYFNNYNSIGEQRLVEDLIVEAIQIQGFDAYYLPNDNSQSRDLLYGEDPVKFFKSAFPLEMYLSSDSMGYEGQQEFFSKFGLEIKDSIKVMVSNRTFSLRVPQNTFNRPREGDLVYVPFLNGTGELYEITFTEQAKDFAMLGRRQPYFYELKLEKFKYSQEVIDTGVQDIDEVVEESGYQIKLTLPFGANNYIQHEIVYQTLDNTFANATTTATCQSFTKDVLGGILTVSNIKGVFTNGLQIIGAESNTRYTLTTYDPMIDNSYNEEYDNKLINQSADQIIDFSETNPFGSI